MAMMTKSRRNLLLIVVLGLIGIFAIRQTGKASLHDAMTQYASEAGPLTADSYAPAEVVKPLNMALWLRAGAQLIDMQPQERGFLRKFIQENPMHPDDSTLQHVEELVRRNEFPLQVLSKAALLKQSSHGLHYRDGMELELPNLMEYLQASLLLGGKWRLEMQKRDPAAAAQTAFLQERIASALTHEPVAIIGIIGHSAEKDFYEFLHRNINTSDTAMLQKEMEYLNHLKGMATGLDRVIAADGAAVYTTISSQFLEEDYFERESLPGTQRISLKISYFFNRPYFLANLLGTYMEFLEYARTPASLEAKNPIDHSWISTMFFSSNVDSFIRRYQAQEAARNLALVAVTMRLQGLRDGIYKKPGSLPKSIYSGETAEYVALPDGSIEISFPQTIKMWDQKFAQGPPERPRLEWKLPPI